MKTLLCISILALSACSFGTSSTRHAPPEAQPIQNQTVVSAPFEEVWDRTIRNLSAQYFVINNVEKASRIINLSVSASDPQDYVDCGTTTVTITSQQYGDRTAQFETAKGFSTFMTTAMLQEGIEGPVQADRSVTLDGRINVYIAPVDQGTEVLINTRYILTGVTAFNTGALQPIPSRRWTLSFNTGSPGSTLAEGGRITCVSKGKIEADILAAAG